MRSCYVFLSFVLCFLHMTSSNKVMVSSAILRVVKSPFFVKVSPTRRKTTFSLCKSLFFGKSKIFNCSSKELKQDQFREVKSPMDTSHSQIQVDIMKAMREANRYLALDDWELLGQEEGIKVWRLKSSLSGDGSEWPCIKSTITVDMKPEELQELFMDSNKVHLLNKYSAGRFDIESLGTKSKIVWNKTKLPYAMKPYDFCSLMHCDVEPVSGHNMIVSQVVTRPTAPISNEFARSEILLGVNILAPCGVNATQTELTSISHVRLANLPAYFARKSAFQGTVNYLTQLKAAVIKLNGG